MVISRNVNHKPLFCCYFSFSTSTSDTLKGHLRMVSNFKKKKKKNVDRRRSEKIGLQSMDVDVIDRTISLCSVCSFDRATSRLENLFSYYLMCKVFIFIHRGSCLLSSDLDIRKIVVLLSRSACRPRCLWHCRSRPVFLVLRYRVWIAISSGSNISFS